MRTLLTVAAALLPAVAGTAPARAEVAGTVAGRYVALGDSFVAGPFIPHQHGDPRACLRSDHNYPSLIAARLRATALVDVSCSGAKTTDMTAAQRVAFGWQNPPQLNVLTPATTLVTLGIGGNDIGYTDISISCGTLGLLNPAGAPCAKRFSRELDRRIAVTGPRVAAVLQMIHQRAPGARVVVVGYPRMLPAGAGCWPAVPLGPADTVFLDGVERSLNAMLRARALAGNAEFVDTYSGGNGHDMCADSRRRWVEGVVPASQAAPLHYNANGMRAAAARVLALLGHARLQPAIVTAPVLAAPGTAPAVPAPPKVAITPGSAVPPRGAVLPRGTALPRRAVPPKVAVLPRGAVPPPAGAPSRVVAPPTFVPVPGGGAVPPTGLWGPVRPVPAPVRGPVPAPAGRGPAHPAQAKVRFLHPPVKLVPAPRRPAEVRGTAHPAQAKVLHGPVRVVPAPKRPAAGKGDSNFYVVQAPGRVRVVRGPGQVRVFTVPGR